MAMIIGVHGIGQQFKGRRSQKAEWLNPLRDGVALARGDRRSRRPISPVRFTATCSDHLAQRGASGLPPYDESDVSDPWEQQLLEAWSREAAVVEPDRVESPEAATKLGRTPRFVQRALDALSHSRFFAGIAERTFIFDLEQVYLYLHDPAIRRDVRAKDRGGGQCAADPCSDRALTRLGSGVRMPLCSSRVEDQGIRHARLAVGNSQPDLRPSRLRVTPHIGTWPGSVRSWDNIADAGDIVGHRQGPPPWLWPSGPEPAD